MLGITNLVQYAKYKPFIKYLCYASFAFVLRYYKARSSYFLMAVCNFYEKEYLKKFEMW